MIKIRLLVEQGRMKYQFQIQIILILLISEIYILEKSFLDYNYQVITNLGNTSRKLLQLLIFPILIHHPQVLK